MNYPIITQHHDHYHYVIIKNLLIHHHQHQQKMLVAQFRYSKSFQGTPITEQRMGGTWKPLDFRFVTRKYKGKKYRLRVAKADTEPEADYFDQLNNGKMPFQEEQKPDWYHNIYGNG